MSIVERCDYMGSHGVLYDLVGCNNQDNVWMQYTGLKDKNRTPIYEGDHFGNPQFYVHFNNGMYCLGGVPLIDYLNGNTLEKIEEIKGNIYENPELLK